MSIATDRPKSDKVKKVLPDPTPKPAQKVLPAPIRHLYQAIGIVEGILIVTPRKAHIETSTGDRLVISQLRDQRLLLWLLGNSQEWQGKLGNWTVYPNGSSFTLACANQPPDLKPGQFRIIGHCRALPDNAISILIRRNHPKDKAYSVLSVKGELPNLRDGDLWKLDCQLQRDRLVLINGLKLD